MRIRTTTCYIWSLTDSDSPQISNLKDIFFSATIQEFASQLNHLSLSVFSFYWWMNKNTTLFHMTEAAADSCLSVWPLFCSPGNSYNCEKQCNMFPSTWLIFHYIWMGRTLQRHNFFTEINPFWTKWKISVSMYYLQCDLNLLKVSQL